MRFRLLLFAAFAQCLPSLWAATAVIRPFTAAPAPASFPVFESALALHVDAQALRDAAGAPLVLAQVPVTPDRAVTLALQPFRVFDARTQWVMVTPAGTVTLPPPAVAMWKGGVEGDPSSLAYLAVHGDTVTGFIRTGGRQFAIGDFIAHVDGTTVTMLHDVLRFPAALGTGSCAEPDIERYTRQAFPDAAASAHAAAVASIQPTSAQFMVRVAFDVDWEAYQFFGSAQAAQSYLTTMVGAMSTVYENEGGVQLTLGFFRVWSTGGEPYSQTDLQGALTEFTDYWATNEDTVSRSNAVLISKKPFCAGGSGACGLAWLDALCSQARGYAAVMISGTYPSMDNSVVAHEIGHNFGLRHTHSCWWVTNGYSPTPIDECYPAEDGSCFTGTTQTDGTIMSYCNSRAFTFGTIVGPYLRSHVVDKSTSGWNCLVPAKKLVAIDTGVSVGVVMPGTYHDSTFRTFLVNGGQQTISVTSMTVSGDTAHFHIRSGGGTFTLPPNGPRSVTLRFQADTAGSYDAVVNVINSGPTSPLHVNLHGMAGTPQAYVDPNDTLYWDDTEAGQVAIVSVFDEGEFPLAVSATRITGPDSASFRVMYGGAPFTRVAGDTARTIGIRFNPTGVGEKRARLLIVSNDPASPASIPLVGGIASGVAETAPGAAGLALVRAWPNPVGGAGATLEFRTARRAAVVVDVADVYGRVVAPLVDATVAPGVYRAAFDAHACAPGTYFYRLRSAGRTITRMFTILK